MFNIKKLMYFFQQLYPLQVKTTKTRKKLPNRQLVAAIRQEAKKISRGTIFREIQGVLRPQVRLVIVHRNNRQVNPEFIYRTMMPIRPMKMPIRTDPEVRRKFLLKWPIPSLPMASELFHAIYEICSLKMHLKF